MQSKNQPNSSLLNQFITHMIAYSLLIIVFVLVWNLVFSEEVNCFLFGDTSLSFIKGFGFAVILDIITGIKQIRLNNSI